MKRTILTAALFAALIGATQADAGIAGTVKGWLNGEIVSIALTALLAIVGSAFGIMFRKVSGTFREAGEFLATLGSALEDRRITRDELAQIIRDGKDVFAIWR